MLKCQLHIHTKEDPVDLISYDAKKLVDYACEKKFDVLAITLHGKFFDNELIQEYANHKKVLLIPGIELEIQKKHILVLNCDKKIMNIKTFEQLKNYKNKNKDCFIIAPHPYYPGKISLHKSLELNLEIFDAIENSYCFTKKLTFNTKAEKLAKKHNLPYIATSDCHILKYLDQSYILLDSKKNIPDIFSAIKKKKYSNIQKPLRLFTIFRIIFQMETKELIKKLFFSEKSN